ncbi:RagB/SusD family nutrient uptake outer membrane protein [Sphingobacterium pedocola]|uniref:RagB/SusD family nutrient uptake outer membrane protein n=1 Tax=Sphingobacterium pedocola TaxID=2082722 RepID=A0ABR9T8N0_9SPHI|nr:RagB/SusD family nutrient uptake outer membrane protein [Sphingobacterium pedocola]MBE8721362.1 RagB/SusD family nutrient uptake outer membrane protein [Sphingobacterium pedocola]
MKKFLIYTAAVLLATSCSDFLDVKPDQKMAIPKTLEHADLLLNDYSSMNASYPTLGEISADDYFLRTNNWQSISVMDERQAYHWQDEDIVLPVQWQNAYRTVYRSNQVLEVLRGLEANGDPAKYSSIWGGAHFYRAFAFHQVARVFSPAYSRQIADEKLGIPLRLSPDLDIRSVRSSVEETYQQVVADYKIAIAHLPLTETLLGRPSKVSAYGGLARTYLDMADYEQAYRYADSCLGLYNELMDFNDLNVGNAMPIARFNKEVIFSASTVVAGPMGQTFGRIDTNLYDSYHQNDLRKLAFFQHNNNDRGTYAFKGTYSGAHAGIFVGLTTGELYLIRAEAAVRTSRLDQALSDINHLLKHRWNEDVPYPDITEQQPDRLLEIILTERRKELVFRGQRWADLKRLNQESRFAKTLLRYIDGKEYRLEPNSPKYAIKIPLIVIEETDMEQNKR